MADQTLGGDEAFDRGLLLVGIAENADAHPGLAQVGRHAYCGDAHEADARVFQVATDDRHDLLANLLPHLVRAVAGHGDLLGQQLSRAQISSRSSRYVSMTSPGSTASNPSSPIPHSWPACISRTSSLKCLSELIRPSNTSSLPRNSLAQPPRLTLPSTTRLPAIMPRRGILIGMTTSALPSRTWR